MRILILHNRYRQAGGEDAVFEAEVDLLRSAGVEVITHCVTNDSITGVVRKIWCSVNLLFSLPSFLTVLRLIRVHHPDVVHVHNFFPLFSPSVFYACRLAGVPVVLTLHNFRIICPTALLMHDMQVTERSIDEGPWWAVRKRVYRGSLLGTFLLTTMIALHRRLPTWRSVVSSYFVLSEFAKGKFERAGLPKERLVIKFNFVADQGHPCREDSGRFLFVGRLSPEKGLVTMLRALEEVAGSDISIDVLGTGPMSPLTIHSGSQVIEHGVQSKEQVRRAMLSSRALVLPSLWYEGFPMVLAEAYACGLPVIASRIGALSELVEDGVTGLLFEPGNSNELAEKLRWAATHADEMSKMGQRARERFDSRYSAECSLATLLATYTRLVANKTP